MFYFSVQKKITELGCHVSTVDPSLFFYIDKWGHLAGILVSHVDDFLHAGNSEFNERMMTPLNQHFLAGKQEEGRFRYVGFDVCQSDGDVQISMDHYIESVEFRKFVPGQKDHELSKSESTEYRAIFGRLNWVVQGARPDKAFDIIELSSKYQSAHMWDLNHDKRTYPKLREQSVNVAFPSLASVSDFHVKVYTDASHANLPDGMSNTYGLVVFLVDCRGHMCPLSWRAGKIWRVVKSPLTAETRALLEGVEEAIYIRKMLSEMCQNVPIDIFVENRSLVEALRRTRFVDNRLLRVDIRALIQTLQCEVRSVSLIPGDKKLADSMTIRGASGAALLAIFQTGKMA